jgi:hypothetical protein
VQGQHRGLGVLPVGTDEVAVLAVEDHAVAATAIDLRITGNAL